MPRLAPHFSNFGVIDRELDQVAVDIRDTTLAAEGMMSSLASMLKRSQRIQDLAQKAAQQSAIARNNPELEDIGIKPRLKECHEELPLAIRGKKADAARCNKKLEAMRRKNQTLTGWISGFFKPKKWTAALQVKTEERLGKLKDQKVINGAEYEAERGRLTEKMKQIGVAESGGDDAWKYEKMRDHMMEVENRYKVKTGFI